MATQLPVNPFKRALAAGQRQIGLWLGLPQPYVAEILAAAGFDWLAIDAEHTPNDPRNVLLQLQAIAPYPVHGVVRTVCDDVPLLKQYLDLGAQTLLVPMVETASQAARIVAATRYAPRGVRGVSAALVRASRWNQVDNYLRDCEREICVLVQVESVLGLGNLDAIATTEGVDGVFFGPADLAASMNLLGQANHPRVQDAICAGIGRVRAAGKAAGVLAPDPATAHKYLDAGALFVAVGVDISLLQGAARNLLAQFGTRGVASG
jgi:4-hydroxy-2-oxoheptanedioate aldolase